MNQIKKIFYFVICFCALTSQLFANSKIINLDLKIINNDVIFIFHRSKNQILDFNSQGNAIYVKTNIPSNFQLSNVNQFNEYAKDLKILNNKQSMSFVVKKGLQYDSIINGEKLDAIRFCFSKKKEKKSKNLSLVSSSKLSKKIKFTKKSNNFAEITYKRRLKDDHVLSLPILESDKDSENLAIFFRGKYLWVISNNRTKFPAFKDQGIFSDFTIIPSSSGTVFRVKLQDGYRNALLSKKNSRWQIILSKKKRDSGSDGKFFKVEKLPEKEEGVIIWGDFKSNSMITFQDPEIGDNLQVLTTKTPAMGVVNKLSFPQFSVLDSIQGVVVSLNSEEVKLKKFSEKLQIISETSLFSNDDINLEAEYLGLPTILPYLDKNLDILNFNQQKARLIYKASEAITLEKKFDKNFQLAEFFFVNELYHESLNTLKLAREISPIKYQTSFRAKFLTAVNYTMTGDYSRAKEIYDELINYRDIPEVNLWNKYNNFSLGNFLDSIGFRKNLAKTINYYSDDKYWPLLFAEIEIELLANNLKIVEKLFKQHKKPSSAKYANNLKFYQAEYYRKKNQLNIAKQLYTELLDDEGDLFNLVRAEFALVKIEKQTGDIDLEESIKRLEAVRLKWRGGQLEYDLLVQLASYYKENDDKINSLRLYKYIQSAFHDKVNNFYITSEMARIFNEVFLEDALGKDIDDFTIIVLFYEFKELNPIGEKGDNVILSIVKRLVRLDLLENAEDLLRHQIKYRLQGKKRVANADNLAIILLMNNKPSDVMLVLDDTDKDNFSFKEHQYRSRIRAKALIDLQKYEDALEYLKDDNTEDAEFLKREALFQAEKWQEYAEKINDNFDQIMEDLDNENSSAIQDILRLAISYYMLEKYEALNALFNVVHDKNQLLKYSIGLLSIANGTIDYRNLDESLNINQMQFLLEKYKKQFLEV